MPGQVDSVIIIGKNTKNQLIDIFQRVRVPRMLILDRDAVIDELTASTLCYVLLFTPEISHLSGNVSRSSWEHIATVLPIVAAHRLRPITVTVSTDIPFDSEQEASNYLESITCGTSIQIK